MVSVPSFELFDKAPAEYRAQVLPQGVPRVSLEAGVTAPWYEPNAAVTHLVYAGPSMLVTMAFLSDWITMVLAHRTKLFTQSSALPPATLLRKPKSCFKKMALAKVFFHLQQGCSCLIHFKSAVW